MDMTEKPIRPATRPLDTLNDAKGKTVLVELKTGSQFMGKLIAFDIHINTVLEDTKEMKDGKTKRNLGTIFIRGDTIILISPSQ